MAAKQLPTSFALKSEDTKKYVRYLHEDVENLHGVLQASAEVLSPYTKLQLEKASTGDGRFVHIRFSYNNKYLRRADIHHWWIVAGADEPNEDQSVWSCTLFEPQHIQLYQNTNNLVLRLRHVQLNHYVRSFSVNDFHSCLYAHGVETDPKNKDIFTVVDWESLVVLPEYVAFKGDNDLYLRAAFIDGNHYLQFSATDPTDPAAAHEVITKSDGIVRIKNTSTQKLWRRNGSSEEILDNWIWVDVDSDAAVDVDSNTWFWPVKVGMLHGMVAFRNLGNNKFVKRLTYSVNSCLSADTSTITTEARLVVKELVLSRKIFDVNFKLNDARIITIETDFPLATAEAENPNKQSSYIVISLLYSDNKTSTWNKIVDDSAFTSLTETTISSATPFVVDGGIKVLDEFTGPYHWGEAHATNTRIETQTSIIVPPQMRVKVTLVATKASVDIPFAYSQTDTFIHDKKNITYHEEGGIYTAVSFYNPKHKIEEEPLN